MSGEIAPTVQLLRERIHFEPHRSIKETAFLQAQRIVPQHQLSRVVGKVAASENPIVKNIAIQAFKSKYQIDLSIAQQKMRWRINRLMSSLRVVCSKASVKLMPMCTVL